MKISELAKTLTEMANTMGDVEIAMYDRYCESMTALKEMKLCTKEEALKRFYCGGDSAIEYGEEFKNAKNVLVMVGWF